MLGINMKNKSKFLIISLISAGVIALIFGFYYFSNTNSSKETSEKTALSKDTSTSKTVKTNTNTTEAQLVYLIEEEKLAHDVYSVMYEKYGANVFGNILNSETSHQGRVLTLLQTRSIPDPRSNQVGVFKNQELQDLYNSLIKQGDINATEAYKAGVAIEEKDIKDISNQLATATNEDIIGTLESLKGGSENHLRAFNRQLQ